MSSPDAIFHEPDWFPDRIDVANRLIRLVPTTRALIGDSAFLDGRTPIGRAGAAPAIVSLDAFVAALSGPVPPQRWIWHRSFCGSTLLARIVTVGGAAFALREPQVLVDLVNWRIAQPAASGFARVRDAVLAKLAQRWHPDEAIVVKPSNWVNPAIAELWSPTRGDRAVLVDIARKDFVVAVLRGGRDRIAYTLRLYAQFERAWPVLAETVARALPDDPGDAMTQAARLIAATHWAQDCMIAARCASADIDGAAATLRFPDFLDEGATLRTRLHDRLGIVAGDATDAGVHLARHSKSPDRPADRAAEAEAGARIRALHRDAIAVALTFGDTLAIESEAVVARIAIGLRASDGCIDSARATRTDG